MASWKSYLDHLRISVFSNQSYVRSDPSQNVTDWMEASMKLRYPGDYTIVEFYDPVKVRFDYRPNFSNSNEELIWKLKNA
jgi:hypothetical protein